MAVSQLRAYVNDGEQQGDGEKDNAEPDGELLQHMGRLRTENVLRHPSAESRTQPFVFGALHEHNDHHEQADQHMEGDKNGNEDRHEPNIMAGRTPRVKPSMGFPR